MKRRLRAILAAIALSLVAAGLLSVNGPANAASLTQVTNFGTNPTNLNMFIYVPDKVAARPALLVLVHYCGGTAGGIFNGNGHDFVTAADRYGYIMVLPEATRSEKCFDVSTAAALRRNGGGDSTGIMSMVAYARQRYNVDPGRIVVSGYSSGAMMTNVLAAQYPDVFAAGSAFSGVPAGCFATTNGSLWNSQCSGGTLIKTAQQWGDQARAMFPGYTGSYPRMQLWHGTTDTTLAYPNFGEEIKQWTNLHGLGQTPGFTDHPQSSWTRTRYGTIGTQATIEGISIAGVGHQLPMAGQVAYAISFLGLDRGTDSTPPTAPANLTASAVGATGANLSWTASTDSGGSGLAGYDILRAPGATGGTFTQVGTAAGTTFTDTGLTAATTYRYQVRSRNAAGDVSAPSNTVQVTTEGGTTTGACTAVPTVQTQWATGYVIQPVTVTNTSTSTITSWAVTFTLPAGHTLTGSWNATVTTSGQTMTAKSIGYNGILAPGATTTFGLQAGRPNGDAALPSGYTCTTP
ncbi:extracellular catalytic domain type 1 short-chain-length polyhydroxyalkanoate depolymerase [Nonomuraea aurantiaca]|uniref:extracellular catalytic domain type 1 short-chain-length polyhydroxyalkanoate depolymerase n=1 Tax=Nonomuraea aurantiaca TaxID=2878562 RepID=UPI001CD965D9|nr:PHB depolymerase family esterase [Nonomuraea aurantiaca]MCA2226080.1 PHB depolymerase family esterase [Nonomuraea aurantiaca]